MKNMKNIRKDVEKEGILAENKLHLECFLEVVERDFSSLIKLSRQRMNVPKDEKKNFGAVDI